MSIVLHPATENPPPPGWRIEPGKPSRKWLSAHAYRCDPLLDANRSCVVIVLEAALDVERNGGPGQNDVVVHAGPATRNSAWGRSRWRNRGYGEPPEIEHC